MSELKLYRMGLKFSLTLGLRHVNDIASQCGFSERAVLKDAVTCTLEQTLTCIPDEDTIHAYEDIIRKNYETDRFTCEGCRFTGYEYVHEIKGEELDALRNKTGRK